MSWNWQKHGEPLDATANAFIKACHLDDTSVTFLSGLPATCRQAS